MSAHSDDQNKKRTTTMKLLLAPKTASQALVKGLVEQFKKSQRLPLLKHLMDANRPQSVNTPADLDIANFYHL
jgi:hypothetical protein